MNENGIRYCILNASSGGIAIAMKGDIELIAGGDFKIYHPDNKHSTEEFKLTIDHGQPSIYKVKSTIFELNKLKLAWSILVCSKKSNIFSGNIQLSVAQINHNCQMTIPTSYNIENIPPCYLKDTQNISGSLFFVLKNENKVVD